MIKAIVKRFVSGDRWEFISWVRDRFGLRAALASCFNLSMRWGTARVPNPLSGHSVLLRPGTADQVVYDEVFLHKEYDIDLGSPNVIVDAGAHIGLSSVYFAGKYPQATVVAIEPEPTNFAMLVANTKRYANIKPIQAGLWFRPGFLMIKNSTVATWSFRVQEYCGCDGIPAMRIEDIMHMLGISKIDVLKMDIEGAELEVLTHSQGWMRKVTNVIIELHDRFKPGCTMALEQALVGYDFERSIVGENVVYRNLRNVESKRGNVAVNQ